jgi:hypothetical protein
VLEADEEGELVGERLVVGPGVTQLPALEPAQLHVEHGVAVLVEDDLPVLPHLAAGVVVPEVDALLPRGEVRPRATDVGVDVDLEGLVAEVGEPEPLDQPLGVVDPVVDHRVLEGRVLEPEGPAAVRLGGGRGRCARRVDVDEVTHQAARCRIGEALELDAFEEPVGVGAVDRRPAVGVDGVGDEHAG